MRMWMIDPKFLCRKHLLGEHLELHMLYGAIKKGKNLDGYIKNGLIEIHNLGTRHSILVNEMKRRGYKHKSSIIFDFALLYGGKVDMNKSIYDLKERCVDCRKLIEGE